MARKPEDVLYTHKPQPGKYLSGIPARDLTARDVERLGAARINNAVASGLYTKAKATTAATSPPAEKTASAGEGDK